MKNVITLSILAIFFALVFSCGTLRSSEGRATGSVAIEDTLTTADSVEYELIVFDPGFDFWLEGKSYLRNQYSNEYLQTYNRMYVNEWNNRYSRGDRRISNYIDYDPFADYPFELNYKLYMYFRYFEEMNRVRLLPRGRNL